MVLARHLGPQERLLWSGRPRQGIYLRPLDLLMIPFSLIWGGFAIFWEYSVIHSHAPLLFRVWGIPFVLAGAYILLGRFIIDSGLRARTFYGLTNDRVLIITRGKVTSVNLRSSNNIVLNEGKHGRGTITFGIDLLTARWTTMGRSWPGMPEVPALEGIERASSVFDLINRIQSETPVGR